MGSAWQDIKLSPYELEIFDRLPDSVVDKIRNVSATEQGVKILKEWDDSISFATAISLTRNLRHSKTMRDIQSARRG